MKTLHCVYTSCIIVSLFLCFVSLDRYWIEGHDYDEGNWLNDSAVPLPYVEWDVREPNGDEMENCLALTISGMHDVSCNVLERVICSTECKPQFNLFFNDAILTIHLIFS